MAVDVKRAFGTSKANDEDGVTLFEHLKAFWAETLSFDAHVGNPGSNRAHISSDAPLPPLFPAISLLCLQNKCQKAKNNNNKRKSTIMLFQVKSSQVKQNSYRSKNSIPAGLMLSGKCLPLTTVWI